MQSKSRIPQSRLTTQNAIDAQYPVPVDISAAAHLSGRAVDSDRFPPGGHAVGGRLRVVASRQAPVRFIQVASPTNGAVRAASRVLYTREGLGHRDEVPSCSVSTVLVLNPAR